MKFDRPPLSRPLILIIFLPAVISAALGAAFRAAREEYLEARRQWRGDWS